MPEEKKMNQKGNTSTNHVLDTKINKPFLKANSTFTAYTLGADYTRGYLSYIKVYAYDI